MVSRRRSCSPVSTLVAAGDCSEAVLRLLAPLRILGDLASFGSPPHRAPPETYPEGLPSDRGWESGSRWIDADAGASVRGFVLSYSQSRS